FFGSLQIWRTVRSWTIIRPSASLLRALRFAVGAACAFSLSIAGQVLTFRTRARLRFAPPTCRMPLGLYQASPKLIPEAGSAPGFDIAYPGTRSLPRTHAAWGKLTSYARCLVRLESLGKQWGMSRF